MFSVRNRDNSICSSVTALPSALLSLPALAAFTQLCLFNNPSSRAVAAIL